MIVNFKYFHEKTDADYEEYKKIWDENKERIIFLQMSTNGLLPSSQQMQYINNNMNNTKDILALRFLSKKEMQRNKLIGNIILGKGVVLKDNKIWYPKEVWIYSLFE